MSDEHNQPDLNPGFPNHKKASVLQVWKYEGSRTLDYYLRRRDCLRALSKDLQVPEEAVVATIMKQIFMSLEVSMKIACVKYPRRIFI